MDDAGLIDRRRKSDHARAAPELLETLERLFQLAGRTFKATMTFACDLVGDATHADKVDVFLYDATRDSMVAVGTSDRRLSARQRRCGLDVLPVRK